MTRPRRTGAAALLALTGCTHIALQNGTVQTSDTLADLQVQQVLDDLARFQADPDAVPSFAVPTAGTASVNDQAGAGISPTYSPTLSNSQQGGGGTLDLAIGKLRTPQRTVVRTYHGEPTTRNLDTTQVTTTEDDAVALAAVEQGRTTPSDRGRSGPAPAVNPGLSFTHGRDRRPRGLPTQGPAARPRAGGGPGAAAVRSSARRPVCR